MFKVQLRGGVRIHKSSVCVWGIMKVPVPWSSAYLLVEAQGQEAEITKGLLKYGVTLVPFLILWSNT